MPHDGVRCASCDDAEEVSSGALTYFFLEFQMCVSCSVVRVDKYSTGPGAGWLALGPSPVSRPTMSRLYYTHPVGAELALSASIRRRMRSAARCIVSVKMRFTLSDSSSTIMAAN